MGDHFHDTLMKIWYRLFNLKTDPSGALVTTATISGDVTIAAETIVTTCTASAVSVSDSSSTVFEANAGRKNAVLVNSGAQDVFVARGATAVDGAGILLKANGGAYEISAENLYKGVVTAVCASGLTSTLSVEEGV